MTYELTLTIDAEPFRFEQWLDRHRLGLSRIIEVKDGVSLGIVVAPTLRGTFQGIRRHEIDAVYLYPSKTDPNAEEASFPIVVFRFEIFEASAGRSLITLSSFHDSLFPVFGDMLTSISHLWPESRQGIVNFFNSLAEENSKPILEVPLDEIPDIGWQRKAVEMWNEGKTAKEIGAILGKDEQTVTNKIATLRKEFPKLVKFKNKK